MSERIPKAKNRPVMKGQTHFPQLNIDGDRYIAVCGDMDVQIVPTPEGLILFLPEIEGMGYTRIKPDQPGPRVQPGDRIALRIGDSLHTMHFQPDPGRYKVLPVRSVHDGHIEGWAIWRGAGLATFHSDRERALAIAHQLAALDKKPPCCGGGPQWGHQFTCPECPD